MPRPITNFGLPEGCSSKTIAESNRINKLIEAREDFVSETFSKVAEAKAAPANDALIDTANDIRKRRVASVQSEIKMRQTIIDFLSGPVPKDLRRICDESHAKIAEVEADLRTKYEAMGLSSKVGSRGFIDNVFFMRHPRHQDARMASDEAVDHFQRIQPAINVHVNEIAELQGQLQAMKEKMLAP